MSEEVVSEAWYASRMSPMIAFGWDEQEVTAFVLQDDHRINERLEWLERALKLATRSQERLERLTNWWPMPTEAVALVTDLLNQPLNAMDARACLDEATEQQHPWEAPLERAKLRWEEEGLVEEWSNLYEALSSMDVSSLGAVALIQPLFDSPERSAELLEHVETVRRDERRQQRLIIESAEALRMAGFDVPMVDEHPLMEALDALEGWQNLQHEVENAMLNAQQLIGPFDDEAAERWVSQLRQIKHLDRRQRLLEMNEEIRGIGQRLERRRQDLTETLNIWRRKGVVFPISGVIQPNELHDWESNMDEISATVERHLKLMEKASDFRRVWPTESAGLEPMVGQLERTDELHQAIESLEQEWASLELDGLAVMEPYVQRNMSMDLWKRRLLDEPRSTLKSLMNRRELWNRQLAITERYEALDVSIEGLEDQQHRLKLLQQSTIEEEMLDEMESYVTLKERRGWRHRIMLEDALGRLRTVYGNLEEINTDALSLAAFEAHVAELERSGGRGAARPLGERAKLGLNRELNRLESDGWDISTWASMMPQQANEIALQLNRARPYIQSIEQLRSRIMAMPWSRDVQMALDIQYRIQQPEQLGRLAESIPKWLQHLAKRPIEHPGFELNLWRPQRPMRAEGSVEMASDIVIIEDEQQLNHDNESSESAKLDILNEKIEPVDDGQEPAPVESPPRSTEHGATHTEPTETNTNSEDSVSQRGVRPLTEMAPVVLKTPTVLEAQSITATSKLNETIPSPSVEMDVEPPAPPLAPSSPVSDSTVALGALETVVNGLGLQEVASAVGARGLGAVDLARRELARHVNQTPRDVRVARLLRLTLRLLPDGGKDDAEKEKLLMKLADGIPDLKRWTRRRLEARHQGATGNMLDDALALGTALERIPGLGRPVPLTKDTWPLPVDLIGLQREVDSWSKAARPPAAGGVRG